MITRVLLVIALLASLAHAQSASLGESMGQSSPMGKCLCRRTRVGFGNPRAIQDVQIYPASRSCNQMEVIVYQKNGMQYCLDPKVKKVQELIRHLQSEGSASVAVPTKHSGTPRPSEDIQIDPTSRPCDKFEIAVYQKKWDEILLGSERYDARGAD